MFCYVYTVIILYITSLTSLVVTNSTTSKICIFNDVGSSKLEISCYNYKNSLRFNIPLTENTKTINLIRNRINALDASSFPIRSEAIEELFLNSNNITELPLGVLRNFPNLQVLDLTDNHISEFHPDVFLENKHLREIYLDENNFEILKSKPFMNLVHLTKVSLEENHLEGCKEETLETLDYFRGRGIATDTPNLCIQLNVSQVDSVNIQSTTSLGINADLPPEETSDSGKNFYVNKNLYYFFEAFSITSSIAFGLLIFICIIRRHKRKNNRKPRTYSGDFLIEEEESGYLTPKVPITCPTYIEILAELDRTSIKSGHYESNVARSAESNCRLQPKLHKVNHVYERIQLPHENPYATIKKIEEKQRRIH